VSGTMEIFTAVSLVQSCSGNLDSCKIFMFSRVRLRLLPLRLGTGIKARKRTGPADSEAEETGPGSFLGTTHVHVHDVTHGHTESAEIGCYFQVVG